VNVEELATPGQRMKWLRAARDTTQVVLAAEATVSQPSISQIERDEFTPRRVIRIRIAEALGVHPDFIWRAEDLANRRRVSPNSDTQVATTARVVGASRDAGGSPARDAGQAADHGATAATQPTVASPHPIAIEEAA